jgi:hypothetical protein
MKLNLIVELIRSSSAKIWSLGCMSKCIIQPWQFEKFDVVVKYPADGKIFYTPSGLQMCLIPLR